MLRNTKKHSVAVGFGIIRSVVWFLKVSLEFSAGCPEWKNKARTTSVTSACLTNL